MLSADHVPTDGEEARRGGDLLHPPDHLDPVELRHIDIQDHERRGRRRADPQRGARIRVGLATVTPGGHLPRSGLQHPRIIVKDQQGLFGTLARAVRVRPRQDVRTRLLRGCGIRRPRREGLDQGLGRHRLPEQVALGQIDPGGNQGTMLGLRFHPLGDHLQPQRLTEVDHGLQESQRLG